ncbi:MAG: Kazal-type serine protease inhibitor, partial [Candidatus Woesearchaeota archaeon]
LLIILVVFLYNQKTGPTCIENWSCEMWSSCSEQITQTRTCTDLNNCGTAINKPSTSQSCNVKKASLLEVPLPENTKCFYYENKLSPKCSQFYEGDGIYGMLVCEKFYNPVYDSNGVFYPSACWAENFGITNYTYGYSSQLKQFINDLWFTKKTGKKEYFKVPEPDIEFSYTGSSFGGDRQGVFFRSTLWKNSTILYTLDYNIDTETQIQQSTFFRKENTLISPYGTNPKTLLVFVMFDNAYPEDILLEWTNTYEPLMNDYIKKKLKVPNPIQYDLVPVVINPLQGVERLSTDHAFFSEEEKQKVFNAATNQLGESDFDIFVMSPVFLNGFGGYTHPWNNMLFISASLFPPELYSSIDKQDGLNSLATFQMFFGILSHEILHTVGMDHMTMGYGTLYLDSIKQYVDPVTGKQRADVPSWCDFFGESPDYYSVEIPDNLGINVGEEPSWLIKEDSSSGPCLSGLSQNEVLKDYDNDGKYEIMYKNNLIGIELQRTLGWVDIDNDNVTEIIDSNPYGGYEEFSANEEQRGELIGPFKFTFIEYQDIGDCKFVKIRLENLKIGLVPLECADFNDDVVNIYNGVNYHWIKIEDSFYGTILLPRLSSAI